MRKGMNGIECKNNKVKGSDKKKMKKAIPMGIIGIILSAMLLASMASPVLANESSAYTPRAFVYGDANEDRTVDMRDVTYIKLVLFKEKPETRLADANYDGKISMLDIGQAKLIVLGKEKELTLLDMADKTVTIPQPPERVIAMSRSLIDTTMYIFGVEDKLVGGSYAPGKSKYSYIYNGTDYTVNIKVRLMLVPKIKELPNVGGFGKGPYGTVNVETIASINPDLLIVRDDCSCTEEDFNRPISTIRGMGIPVIVLKYLNCYDDPDISTMYEEIELLGEIFDNQEKAAEINEYLDSHVQFILERIEDIKEEDKPKVLYFGAPSSAGKEGGVGFVFGVDQIESSLLEKIVNAKNAYTGVGVPIMSSEQLLNLDPDIIIITSYGGFHPPREMYEEERFKNIQDLRALKDKRVYTLAPTPCRSERLEFPINLMIEAKAVYPERFKDIDLDEWIGNYFQGLYHVDDETVEELKEAKMLYYLEITSP